VPVHAFDVLVPANLRIGYVTAESEPVPEALQRLGIRVEMLDAVALASGTYPPSTPSWSAYAPTNCGRTCLERISACWITFQGRNAGGAIPARLCLGQIPLCALSGMISPPLRLQKRCAAGRSSLPRITDENSPVKFLKPNDSLLSHPNKITKTSRLGAGARPFISGGVRSQVHRAPGHA